MEEKRQCLCMCIRCQELRVELPPGTNRLKDEPEICAICKDLHGLVPPRAGETKGMQVLRALHERIRFAREQVAIITAARNRILSESHRAGEQKAQNLRDCAKDYEAEISRQQGIILQSQSHIKEILARYKEHPGVTGAEIQEMRIKLGLTRAGVAAELKISPDYLKKIEKGKRLMPPEAVQWLLETRGTKPIENGLSDIGVA